jgi:hypothetical protein
MMYGLKPFNGAEMRAYLDVLNEAPPAYNPKGVPLPAAPTTTPQLTDKDQQDYQSWSAADRTQRAVGTGQSDMYGSNDPRAKFNNPVNAFGAQDKDTDAIVARQQGIMRQSAGSPEREQQFINKSMADLETMANRKVRPDESVQEDELSELRRYVDMVEANETPAGAGQFSTKQMGDGTKVSFDPATGGKTVSGADGATSYNVAGQKISHQTPSIKGFQKSTNYQTGEKTTTGQVGPVGISATQRPDQSTVTTAEVPLGADVTAKVAQGIGFGGAGKDVQQGGNQVSSITTRTAQNPQGTTSSFVGKPTDQQLDQALESKVTSPDLPKKGLNQQQKSVNQMPALFKPKGIKVLGNKKDPDHPAKGYFVGANESEQMMAAEDMLGKIRRDLTDYLRSVEDEIGGRDRSLMRKAKHDIMTPKLAQLVPAKTMYTDDGKEIKIHGNQDDGFRITVREKTLPSTFDSLEEAAMACEMYCAHRRGRYNEADSDYLDERDTDIV